MPPLPFCCAPTAFLLCPDCLPTVPRLPSYCALTALPAVPPLIFCCAPHCLSAVPSTALLAVSPLPFRPKRQCLPQVCRCRGLHTRTWDCPHDQVGRRRRPVLCVPNSSLSRRLSPYRFVCLSVCLPLDRSAERQEAIGENTYTTRVLCAHNIHSSNSDKIQHAAVESGLFPVCFCTGINRMVHLHMWWHIL